MYLTMGSQLAVVSKKIDQIFRASPSVVVDLISIAGGIDNVESETDLIFLDDFILLGNVLSH